MIAIVPERLEARMAALGLTQTAVADAIGVKPPSISRLVKGKHAQTRHIFSLARAVRTTPEYLTGVTDDPDLDSPESPALTAGEAAWVDIYRGFDDRSRRALMHVARSMTSTPIDRVADATALRPSAVPQGETVMMPVLFPPEAYLTRMFEALLAMVDPAAPTEEQARSLAQNLPIGLSQLRDLLPLPSPADATTASSDQPKTLVGQS